MPSATRPCRSSRLLVVAVGAVVVAAACSGTNGTRHAGSRPTSTTTSVSSTAGTTVPTGGCSTPTIAARAVVDAWLAGDRATAAPCATPDAVATLFARSGRSAAWTFQSCDGPDPGVPVCTFAYPGGIGRLTLHGTEAAGWSVDRVELATS
jgi:ABC-type phosphate transport system substrate-binding protein